MNTPETSKFVHWNWVYTTSDPEESRANLCRIWSLCSLNRYRPLDCMFSFVIILAERYFSHHCKFSKSTKLCTHGVRICVSPEFRGIRPQKLRTFQTSTDFSSEVHMHPRLQEWVKAGVFMFVFPQPTRYFLESFHLPRIIPDFDPTHLNFIYLTFHISNLHCSLIFKLCDCSSQGHA